MHVVTHIPIFKSKYMNNHGHRFYLHMYIYFSTQSQSYINQSCTNTFTYIHVRTHYHKTYIHAYNSILLTNRTRDETETEPVTVS